MSIAIYFLFLVCVHSLNLRSRPVQYSNCPYEGLTDSTFNSPECAAQRYAQASVALQEVNKLYKDLIIAYTNGTSFIKSLVAQNATLENIRNIVMGPTGTLGTLMDERVVGSLYRGASIVWNASKAMDAPVRSLVNESYVTAISFRDAWRMDSAEALAKAASWLTTQDVLVNSAKNALEQTILSNADNVLKAILANSAMMNSTLNEATDNITNVAAAIQIQQAAYATNTTGRLANLTSLVELLNEDLGSAGSTWAEEFEKIINLPLRVAIDAVYVPKLRDRLQQVVAGLVRHANDLDSKSRVQAVDIFNESQLNFDLLLNSTRTATDFTGYTDEIQGHLNDSVSTIKGISTRFTSRSTDMFSNLTAGVMADKNLTFALSNALNTSRIEASDWSTELRVRSGNLTTLIESERLRRLNEAKNSSLAAANSTFNALLQNVNEAFLMRKNLMLEAQSKKNAISSILARLSDTMGGNLENLFQSLEQLSTKIGVEKISTGFAMTDGPKSLAKDVIEKTNEAANSLVISSIGMNAAIAQDELVGKGSIAALQSAAKFESALTEQAIKATLALESVRGEKVALASADSLRRISTLMETQRGRLSDIMKQVEFVRVKTATESSNQPIAEAAQLISAIADAIFSEVASLRALVSSATSSSIEKSNARLIQSLADATTSLEKAILRGETTMAALSTAANATVENIVGALTESLRGLTTVDEATLSAIANAKTWAESEKARLRAISMAQTEKGLRDYAAGEESFKHSLSLASLDSLIREEFAKATDRASEEAERMKALTGDFVAKQGSLKAMLKSKDDAVVAKIGEISHKIDFDQGAAAETIKRVDEFLISRKEFIDSLIATVGSRAGNAASNLSTYGSNLTSTLDAVKRNFISEAASLTSKILAGLESAGPEVQKAFDSSNATIVTANISQATALEMLNDLWIQERDNLRRQIANVSRTQQEAFKLGAYIPVLRMKSEISRFYEKTIAEKTARSLLVSSIATNASSTLNSTTSALFNRTGIAQGLLSSEINQASAFLTQVDVNGSQAIGNSNAILKVVADVVSNSQQAVNAANEADKGQSQRLSATLQTQRDRLNTAISAALQIVGNIDASDANAAADLHSPAVIQGKFTTLLSSWGPYVKHALESSQQFSAQAKEATVLNDAKIQAAADLLRSKVSEINSKLNGTVLNSNVFFRDIQRAARGTVVKYNQTLKMHQAIHESGEKLLEELKGNASEVLRLAKDRLDLELAEIRSTATEQESKWNTALDLLN